MTEPRDMQRAASINVQQQNTNVVGNQEESPEVIKTHYAKIDPKAMQEQPASSFNIKIPNLNLSKKKSLEEMNTHLEKVELNIPKGQFLPKPPVLAPILKPIMTDMERVELENQKRREQLLRWEVLKDPMLFSQDVSKKEYKKSKTSLKLRATVEETNPQPSQEYIDMKKNLEDSMQANEDLRRQLEELKAERDANIEAVQRYKELFDSQVCKENKLNFAFLYASPLVIETSKKTLLPQAPISFEREVKLIKSLAKQQNVGVLFKKSVATKRSFDEILANEPKIIHISCHGLLEKKTSNPLQKGVKGPDNVIESLLFEGAAGKGEKITKNELHNLMKKKSGQIDLVFLAACTSQFVGEMFQSFGVNHAICVKRNYFVKDEAAIDFTRIFYLQLFQGKQICEAFEFAKASVQFNHKKTDSDMFTIFTRKDQPKHVCFPIGIDFMIPYKNLTDLTLIKQLPVHKQELQSREIELYYVNELTLLDSDGKCSVSFVLGKQGVGKSHLVRSTLQYMQQRKEFQGGVILMQLSGVKRVETMLLMLMQIVYSQCQFDQQQLKSKQQQAVFSTGKMQVIIDFLNLHLPLKSRDPELRQLRNNKVLLCLDNAQDLVDQDAVRLRRFLWEINQSCPKSKIVLTSSNGLKLEPGSKEVTEKFVPEQRTIHGLEPVGSVNLFLSMSELKADSMSDDFIIDFLMTDPGQTMEEKDLRKRVKASSLAANRVNLLSQHELFTKMLKGNAMSIELFAKCFKIANSDPDRKDKNNLIEVYKALKIKLEEQPITDENELTAMTQVAMGDLHSKYQHQDNFGETQKLIELLSKLPGGIRLPELRQIWVEATQEADGPVQDVDQVLARLKEWNLIDESVEKPATRSVVQEPIVSLKLKNGTDSQSPEICNIIANFYNELLFETCQSFKTGNSLPLLQSSSQDVRRGGKIYSVDSVANLEKCFDFCTDKIDQSDITFVEKKVKIEQPPEEYTGPRRVHTQTKLGDLVNMPSTQKGEILGHVMKSKDIQPTSNRSFMSSQEKEQTPALRKKSLANIEFEAEGEEAEAPGDQPEEEDGAPEEMGVIRGQKSEQTLLEIGEEEEYPVPGKKGKVAIKSRPRQARQADQYGEEEPQTEEQFSRQEEGEDIPSQDNMRSQELQEEASLDYTHGPVSKSNSKLHRTEENPEDYRSEQAPTGMSMINPSNFDPNSTKGRLSFRPLRESVPPSFKNEKKEFFGMRNSPYRKNKFATNSEIFIYQQAQAYASKSGAKGQFAPAMPLKHNQYRIRKQQKQSRGFQMQQNDSQELSLSGKAYLGKNNLRFSQTQKPKRLAEIQADSSNMKSVPDMTLPANTNFKLPEITSPKSSVNFAEMPGNKFKPTQNVPINVASSMKSGSKQSNREQVKFNSMIDQPPKNQSRVPVVQRQQKSDIFPDEQATQKSAKAIPEKNRINKASRQEERSQMSSRGVTKKQQTEESKSHLQKNEEVMQGIDALLLNEDNSDKTEQSDGGDESDGPNVKRIRDNVDQEKEEALQQYAQARQLTEKEEQLARREKEQQEQQIYIRLQYEADQREHLEQLQNQIGQREDDDKLLEDMEQLQEGLQPASPVNANDKLSPLAQRQHTHRAFNDNAIVAIEELPQQKESRRRPVEHEIQVVKEVADRYLGVRAKFLVHFVVVKFMDLDLSYAFNLCERVLGSVNQVAERNLAQDLLAANLTRIQMLTLSLLQAAKDAAYFDQRSAMIFAESRADEEQMVKQTPQQMQDRLSQALAIYTPTEVKDSQSTRGQALCHFQMAVLIEKNIDRSQVDATKLFRRDNVAVPAESSAQFSAEQREDQRRDIVVMFEKAARLFEEVGHKTGQLLSLEHALKNQDINCMPKEELDEKLDQMNKIRDEHASVSENTELDQIFSQEILLMLELIYTFD